MKFDTQHISPQKQAAIFKSFLWSSLIDIFKSERKIDISENIISVKKNISSFTVSVNNPILKQEYIFLEDKISESFHKKLSKMWITGEKFKIKMR